MNKFLLLMLAHMIADYPLQTDWVFKVRYAHRSGILVHILLQVLTTIILLFPYLLSLRTWLAIAGIFVTHLLIDQIRKNNIWVFLLDQVLHLGVIIAATLAMRGVEPVSLPIWLADFWFNNPPYYGPNRISYRFFCRDYLDFVYKGYLAPGIYCPAGFELLREEHRSSGTRVGLCFGNTGLVYISPIFYIFIVVPPTLRMFFWQRWRDESGHYQNVYLADIVTGFVYTMLVACITIICADYLIPSIIATA